MGTTDLGALVEDALARSAPAPAPPVAAPATPAAPGPPAPAESTRLRSPRTIGRSGVLAAGTALVEAVAAGGPGPTSAQHVAVVAPAGHGKTRVLREVLTSAAAHGTAVARGRAVPAARAAVHAPLADALAPLLTPADAGRGPGPALAVALRLGAPAAGGDAASQPPSVLARAVVDLARSREEHGLLLALDDLQWADPETLEVLRALAESAPGPVGLVLAARPGSQAVDDLLDELETRGVLTVWRLGGLDAEDSARLVEAVAGARLPPALTQSVAQRADGVPLVVEELVNALLDAGLARRGPGGLEVADTPALFDVLPSGLRDSVTRKIDALDETARALVRVAALLGREVRLERASSVAGLTGPEARAAATRLVEVGLLERVAGRDRYRFDHALTRDAVLEALDGDELRALAQEVVEATDPDVADPAGLEQRAELLLVAGRDAEAAQALLRAGRGAARGGALATSERLLRQAAGHAPEAHGELVRVLALAGRNDAAAQAGAGALRRLAARPDLAAGVHLALARVAEVGGHDDDATAHLAAAEQLLPPDHPGLGLVRARVLLARRRTAAAEQTVTEVLGLRLDADQACEALELLARCARARDGALAERLLTRMAAHAADQGLLGWRLRALSELGTGDVMRLGDGTRLEEARRTALARGDLVTATMVSFHDLVRRYHRCETDGAEELAAAVEREALTCAIAPVAATCRLLGAVFAVLSGRREVGVARMHAMATDDLDPDRAAALEGIGLVVVALTDDDVAAARTAVERAVARLRPRESSDPLPAWGTWALLGALAGEEEPVREVRRRGVDVNQVNAGLARWAEAVLAGAAGDPRAAGTAALEGLALLARAPWYAATTLRLVLPVALAQGWADPLLEPGREAAGWLLAHGFEAPGRALAAAAGRPARPTGDPYGLTAREREVFDLVRLGRSNAEVAASLVISPRTVEKHVERLLAKTGTSTRVQLVALDR